MLRHLNKLESRLDRFFATADVMLQANITLTYYVRLYDAERQIKMEAERRRRRRSMALASLTGEDLSKMDAAQIEQLRKLTSRKAKDDSRSNSRRPSLFSSNLQLPERQKRRSNSLCVPGTSRVSTQRTSTTQDHLETAGCREREWAQAPAVQTVGSGQFRLAPRLYGMCVRGLVFACARGKS